MIYKIKRFSKWLEEKLFVSNKAEDQFHTIYKEILKCLEMWNNFRNGGSTKHWIEVLSGLIQNSKGLEDCPQGFFAVFDDSKNRVGRIGSIANKCKILGGMSKSDILKYTQDLIYNEEPDERKKLQTGKTYKYRDQIDLNGGFQIKLKDFDYFLKYMALTLSGQYNEGPWDDQKFILTEKVDYTRKVKYTPKELMNKIIDIFVSYLGPNSIFH